MEPLVVETSLEIGDWQALQYYLTRRAMGPPRTVKRVVGFLGAVAFAVALLFGSEVIFGRDVLPGMAIGVIVGVAFLSVQLSRRTKQLRPTPDSRLFYPTRLQFDATGIRSSRAGFASFSDWGSVQAVDEASLHVFIAIDRAIAYVIPKRSITSVTPEEFVNRLRAFREGFVAAAVPTAGASNAASTVAAVPEPVASINTEPLPAWMTVKVLAPVEQPPLWQSLRSNLISGLRVLGARNVSASRFVSTFDQVLALLIVTVALALLLDWQRAPAGAVLTKDGFYSWSMWLGMGVVTCAALARIQSTVADTRKVLVIALSVMPALLTGLWLLGKIPVLESLPDAFSILMIAILLYVGLVVVRVSQGFVSMGSLVVVLIASLVLARADQYIYLDTHMWQAGDESPEEESYSDWDATESQLFNEPERITEAVDALASETPGTSDVYYVGFAGDGSQGVFRREALFGEKTFAARMGTGPRSLELINDENDRIAHPLGSLSGLRYALSLLGSRMNPSEDILVLFLTSHGSQSSGISVQNGGFPLSDIEPEPLRRALDASRIQWRIVIVSACYAGIFVEPLKDDHTLVITAADAEHTSFGCADDRDLTYFGEAFLRDALPKATSLEQAFKTARAAIRAREKEEKLTPSNPQMYLGKAMREKLASLGTLPLAPPQAHN